MRKRKQSHRQSSTESPKTTVNRGGDDAGQSPFPDHSRPTPEECLSVRDDLLSLHGFPQEFMKYRNQRLKAKTQLQNSAKVEPLIDEGESDERESVLDGLVRTILSQNTTELNSQRAFASLKEAFPTWQDVLLFPSTNPLFSNSYISMLLTTENSVLLVSLSGLGSDKVLEAESKYVEDAIRCGGLAPMKSSCIKNMLSVLLEKKGKLCMEYLRYLSVEEVKAELSHMKGIGPKTVSCVLMFNLQHDDFPVDTHVFQIAKRMGWVPGVANVKATYVHLNQRIPSELKFDLNCLLYTHGKVCRGCSNRKVGRKNKEAENGGCPLLAYSEQCSVEKEVRI